MPARRSKDPMKAHARQAKAQRRVGEGSVCADCGGSEALVARSRPKRCQECYQRKRGMKTTQRHHIAGRANSPVTVEVPANAHCDKLSPAQYEWPPETLQNPDGSPLLRAAGALRGSCDFIAELILQFIESCAVFLEEVNAWLCDEYGERWWHGSPFEDWQPQ